MTGIEILSPLAGWAGTLDEVDDEVFAARMLGDGIAIDPTDAVLCAPCDGEITALPESAHAVTMRSDHGAELLLHVGIDTVALKGAGFQAVVAAGHRVTAGQPLIRFDPDRLARNARSLVTPVIVTEPERFQIAWRREPGTVRRGELIMTLRPTVVAAPQAAATAGSRIEGTLRIELEHGLHARPAAILVQSLRQLRAEVNLSLRGRTVNARSAVALLSLGARHGDTLTLHADGDDAALVQGALEQALARAGARSAGPALPVRRTAATATDGAAATIASEGIALGSSVRITRGEPDVPAQGAGAQEEMQRFDDARSRLRAKLTRLAAGDAGARAGIIGAHLEFLEDPELLAAAYKGIAEGRSAGYAWRAAVNAAIRVLGSVEDSHIAARADDLRDLELQLLEILAGVAESVAQPLPAGAILIARDLLPSQFLALDAAKIAGICTLSRAATSHVAILAGAMGLPMLTGVDAGLLAVPDGTTILLDAERGRVIVTPDSHQVAEAESRIAERARVRARLRTAAALDCRTADGKRIEVLANVGSAAEAAAAVASGAEGCGLLRTEFLFLDRLEPPDTAEQTRQYQEIVNAFAGRTVVVRTLDAGSDKPIPFLAMPAQDNPALGLRGIRASLWQPELLRAQIAAILALRPAGRCKILLPMVNDVAEIEAVRQMIRELAPTIHCDPGIAVGIMVETPAAAIGAARLAPHADFFSIGTNDLTQYLLAVDRTHPTLAGTLDALHPVVLRMIETVCKAAHSASRPVAVCGSLASEPAAAPLLVGLGVGELSAVPGAIPAVKDAVRKRTLGECRELARRALELDNAAAVRHLIGGHDG